MTNRLVNIARQLRRKQTPQEKKLWAALRGRNFVDLKFRRQYPVGKYVADFCCFDKKLIIELDGGGHNQFSQIIRDKNRDAYLSEQGFTVLRVWNNELDNNFEGVIDKIRQLIIKH